MKKLPALVVVLLLVDSLHFVWARLLIPHLPPTASSFFYMSIATIQVALFAGVRRQIDWQVLRDNAKFFLIIGFLIAIATSTSFTAVAYIDPGTAALVGRMNTIFALGFGILWLKEKLVRREQFGALIAVIGVFVISFQPGGAGSQLWLGTMLVLVSTFAYSFHTAIVKRDGGEMDFTNFFLFRMAATIFFLLIFALARQELVWPTGGDVWLILFLTATINVTLSRTLYYLVLRRFKLSIFTILLTLTPVVTILWSIFLFDERPSLQGLLGGAAVILGVILVSLNQRSNAATQDPVGGD